MSELSLLNLLGSGIDDITVVNRTETNAYKLATKHGVNYNTLESLPTLLTNLILLSVQQVRQILLLQNL